MPHSATQAEIKAAYYELSLKYHPDVNKSKDKLMSRQANENHVVGALCGMRLLVVFWTITVNICTPPALGGEQNSDPSPWTTHIDYLKIDYPTEV